MKEFVTSKTNYGRRVKLTGVHIFGSLMRSILPTFTEHLLSISLF